MKKKYWLKKFETGIVKIRFILYLTFLTKGAWDTQSSEKGWQTGIQMLRSSYSPITKLSERQQDTLACPHVPWVTNLLPVNCMVMQNTIVGGSSIGGQLQQGVRSRSIDNGLCKGLPQPFPATWETGDLVVNSILTWGVAPLKEIVTCKQHRICMGFWLMDNSSRLSSALTGVFGMKNLFLANLYTMGCLPIVE